MQKEREFDIVIYGATGFTGQLIAEYLLRNYGAGDTLKWAIAGRNGQKLTALAAQLQAGSEIELIVADTQDPVSIKSMVSRTKVLVTTVGPYQIHGGSTVVEACAEAGTDYVDLCGEPTWIRQMIDAHLKSAQSSGARLVFSCGFDSVPSDLGVMCLQQTASTKFNSALDHVKCRVLDYEGSASGGTIATIAATAQAAQSDAKVLALLVDPFALVPEHEGVPQPDGSIPVYDEDFGSWVAPFIMATINTRTVHRTNALSGYAYGESFRYEEMVLTGAGDSGREAAHELAHNPFASEDVLRKPGEGPTKEEQVAGYYKMAFWGKTKDKQILQVLVTGDSDPGYGSTSKIIAESAVALAMNESEVGGGIWTPASALGKSLLERLPQNAGVTFDVQY